MDEDRFRKELEARRQAHGGDLPAAVDEVLGQVIADVETMPSNWKELREADELLEGDASRHRAHGNGDSADI